MLAAYVLLAVPVLLVLAALVKPGKRSIRRLPTVGGSPLPLLSWIGAVHYILRGGVIIQEGYEQYKPHTFRHAEMGGWHVIITSPNMIDELHRAPDDALSFIEATNVALQMEYTLSPAIHLNEYHVPIIRSQLTRSLPVLFPELRDEIVTAFENAIPVTHEWRSICAMEAVMDIVCRTSNRLFVGLPLCRNQDYCTLNKQFTIDVFAAAAIINLFPPFLKPIAGRIFTNVPPSINRGLKHLKPIIEHRMRMMEEYGDEWLDKPNDMLQWLMDEAKDEEYTVRALVLRMLTINMAAIHTSSLTFTQALFLLAAHPEHIPALREEVETVVEQTGWTKAAMNKMRKIDSFMKETQRFTGLGAKSMTRKALKDFTFSDGTFVPAGTLVSAASRAMHFDEDHYEHPDIFDPFRFSNIREEEGEGLKHHMVTTSLTYISFGHGKHACPGRFFAANELKAMLAHVVMTYDVKMENEGVLPDWRWFGTALVPDRKAKVLFRKRQAI